MELIELDWVPAQGAISSEEQAYLSPSEYLCPVFSVTSSMPYYFGLHIIFHNWSVVGTGLLHFPAFGT